jgi:hypothetical protein
MSADNRICLMEWDGQWVGWHGSCSVNYDRPLDGPYTEYFPDKKKAVAWALKEGANTLILEGGITIIGIEEQKTALKEIIEDATLRLDNLNKWGYQNPTNNDLNFR